MISSNEIVRVNENVWNDILIESINKHKRKLYTYYKNWYNCEPVLMVTFVANTVQYGKIVPETEFMDIMEHYVETLYLDDDDRDAEKELINFHSIMLKDL